MPRSLQVPPVQYVTRVDRTEGKEHHLPSPPAPPSNEMETKPPTFRLLSVYAYNWKCWLGVMTMPGNKISLVEMHWTSASHWSG